MKNKNALQNAGNTGTGEKAAYLRTNAQTEAHSKEVVKRTAKDSVFRDLFGNPRYLIELYQVLHPEDKDVDEDKLGIVTIKNVLLDQRYNDLGFTVDDRLLVLVEAQSKWSVNIIVRIFLYLAQTWQEYIVSTRQNIYGSGKLKLPRPELYVIYSGSRKQLPEIMYMSEEFFENQNCAVEIKVKVLYGDMGEDIISQYVSFTKEYDKQVKLHGRTRRAVLETIHICKERDILKEYLETREKEVVDIMMTPFDQEYAIERFGEDKKAEGEMKKARETAYELEDMGLSLEKIAKAVRINEETVRQWLIERTVPVE